ncbi:MAG TPA: hypothetical protein VK524_22275 [Polyangiaceae bacterium]|nr:hypothetical protein [Polyangiaceae bacterium]
MARLILNAAEAAEYFGEDELEAFAEKQRAARRARHTDPLELAIRDLENE